VRRPLTVRRVALIATASLMALVTLMGSLALWVSWSSSDALDRALRAVADGRPVPAAVDLRLVGMEVALDDQTKLRTVLRNGFAIKRSAYVWEAFPRRAFVHAIGLDVDIDMVCEVYSNARWTISCSQIKCMVSPCRIHLGPNGIGGLDSSEPPNKSLERTRER